VFAAGEDSALSGVIRELVTTISDTDNELDRSMLFRDLGAK
jgi:hypothetical protein